MFDVDVIWRAGKEGPEVDRYRNADLTRIYCRLDRMMLVGSTSALCQDLIPAGSTF